MKKSDLEEFYQSLSEQLTESEEVLNGLYEAQSSRPEDPMVNQLHGLSIQHMINMQLEHMASIAKSMEHTANQLGIRFP